MSKEETLEELFKYEVGDSAESRLTDSEYAAVLAAMTEYAHLAIEEAAQTLGYKNQNVVYKEAILKLKEKY